MYTLEDVAENELFILCPEEWQRDAMIEYFENVLGDMGWEDVEYNEYGESTCFMIEKIGEEVHQFISYEHGDYIGSYGSVSSSSSYPGCNKPKHKYIAFEEFLMKAYDVDSKIFESFLLDD